MDIKIAVCDDCHEQAEYIKMLVDKWVNENNIETTVEMFENAENFKYAWSAWNENKSFDILLLDIQMDGQNGVELAKELRKTDEKLIIIFITALSEFIQEGYDVSALHYFLKPVNTEKLYAALDKALKALTKNNNNAVFLSADNGVIKVLPDDVIYIESFDHFLEVTTVQEKLTVKMPLYELERSLGGNFIRCHRCYIVNLKYIKKIARTEITLDSNEKIPLSRRLYTDVNRAVIKHFRVQKDKK
jgi:DNA-binding LytR/AlgR family response regulator